MIPMFAVVAYSSESNVAEDTFRSEFENVIEERTSPCSGSKKNVSYFALHHFVKRGDEYHFGAGNPLKERHILTMLKAARRIGIGGKTEGDSGDEGFEARRLLYKTDNLMVWHRPMSHAKLYFYDHEIARAETFMLPGLVFAVKQIKSRTPSLSIVAHSGKGKGQVSTKRKIFMAPFPNIYNVHRVCQGSMEKPDVPLDIASIPVWERSFFGSCFTHFGEEQVLAGRKFKSLRGYYKHFTEHFKETAPSIEQLNAIKRSDKSQATIMDFINEIKK